MLMITFLYQLRQSVTYGTGHVLEAISGITNSVRPTCIIYVYNGLSLWRYSHTQTHAHIRIYLINESLYESPLDILQLD